LLSLQGSSLETACTESHLLRQFLHEPHSPPDRPPRWVAGFLVASRVVV